MKLESICWGLSLVFRYICVGILLWLVAPVCMSYVRIDSSSLFFSKSVGSLLFLLRRSNCIFHNITRSPGLIWPTYSCWLAPSFLSWESISLPYTSSSCAFDTVFSTYVILSRILLLNSNWQDVFLVVSPGVNTPHQLSPFVISLLHIFGKLVYLIFSFRILIMFSTTGAWK